VGLPPYCQYPDLLEEMPMPFLAFNPVVNTPILGWEIPILWWEFLPYGRAFNQNFYFIVGIPILLGNSNLLVGSPIIWSAVLRYCWNSNPIVGISFLL
jgi:hypothetical protein